MVFWILLGIAAGIVIWAFIHGVREEGFLWSLLALVVAAFFSGVVLLLYSAIVFNGFSGALSSTPHEYSLKAMTTSTKTEGRVGGGIFVVSGYVNERQVFSYIRDNGDGGSVLRQAPADDSTIYEGPVDPTVEYVTSVYGNPWLHPFTTERNHSFVFTVPDGSVSNQIEVTP